MIESSALPRGEGELRSRWDEPAVLGLPRLTWLRVGIVCLLLAGLFWPNLRRLWLKTNPFTGEANWGHSFFVPLIGLYYLYLNREELLSPPSRKPLPAGIKMLAAWLMAQVAAWGFLLFAWIYTPSLFHGPRGLLIAGPLLGVGLVTLALVLALPSMRAPLAVSLRRLIVGMADRSSVWFGLCCLLWGMWFYAWAIWPGQNDLFKDCSMIATLFGVVLMLCGWETMRVAWFPIFFLGVAFPWPQLVYSQIAMPLQKLAASSAVLTLQITGVEAQRVGTKLSIALKDGGYRHLDVAEACAGLKSLMTFVAVGAAVGFLSSRAMWQKIIIAASAVPIAIFCNMLRVAGQGLLDYYVSQNLSQSFAHQFVGMIMLIPAFFLILLVAWVLDNIFIEEVDKHAASASRSAARDAGLVIEIPRGSVPPPRPAPSQPAAGLEGDKDDLAAATMLLTSARPRRKPEPERKDA